MLRMRVHFLSVAALTTFIFLGQLKCFKVLSVLCACATHSHTTHLSFNFEASNPKQTRNFPLKNLHSFLFSSKTIERTLFRDNWTRLLWIYSRQVTLTHILLLSVNNQTCNLFYSLYPMNCNCITCSFGHNSKAWFYTQVIALDYSH